MDAGQIINFFHGMAWAISKMPEREKIKFFSGIFFILSLFYMMIIGPIIFNFFILKNIQKRLGVMFSYDDLYRQVPFGQSLLRQFDASSYIAWQWIFKVCRIKIKLSRKVELVLFQMYFLRRVGFTIDMATKFEIFMSLSIVFCGAYVCIIAPIIWNLA